MRRVNPLGFMIDHVMAWTSHAWAPDHAEYGGGQTKTERRHYKLADLLAQCDEAAPMSAEARAFDAAEPMGREVI